MDDPHEIQCSVPHSCRKDQKEIPGISVVAGSVVTVKEKTNHPSVSVPLLSGQSQGWQGGVEQDFTQADA